MLGRRLMGIGRFLTVTAAVAMAAFLMQGCGSDSDTFICTYCTNGAFYDCSISEVACSLARDTGDTSQCYRNPNRDGECL